MTAQPPRWTPGQLEAARQESIARFRVERMQEPIEAYIDAFQTYRAVVDDLLELTIDLSAIAEAAVDILTQPRLLEAARYLSGPPISVDDLKVLAQTTLAPALILRDPDAARRTIDTILLGLDRSRFPWLSEHREPTEDERSTASIASAAMMAARKVMTKRANESKTVQEKLVADQLRANGLSLVSTRTIVTLDDAPHRGEFCGESLFGERKADLVVRLWDGRVMPLECKVSNSATNSVKRLNNDAAVKAHQWIQQFGTAQTVPAAVLSGVFKRHNLEQAQDRGLTLFWAHALSDLVHFVDATRPAGPQ